MKKAAYLIRKAFTMVLRGDFSLLMRNMLKFLSQLWYRYVYELIFRRDARRWLSETSVRGQAESVYTQAKNSPGGIFTPMQNDEEFLSLLHHVFDTQQVKNVMEIGSYNGGSLFCFTRMAQPGGIVISVDLPGGFFGGGCTKWKTELFRLFGDKTQTMVLIRGNSHDEELPEHMRAILNGEKLDFLFIDGDHTYAGVKQDFSMYSPFVRSGGYVAFHDIIPSNKGVAVCNVKPLWDELKTKFKYAEFLQSGNIGIGVVKLP